MSPARGRAASNRPVGHAATSNGADQLLIVEFTFRSFCNAWKDVTEDAKLWAWFLKCEQQNWVMEIPYFFQLW